MEIINISKETKVLLRELDLYYSEYCEMSNSEKLFLTETLKQTNPKKILELGISAGGTSVLILNAIKDIPNAHLYSIDYLNYYYKNPNKKVGFIIDKYPDLQKKHTIFSGAMATEFIDQIGRDIDFCFIDTSHVLPGEILDFLIVLPFLKKDCTVVFHDTNLQTFSNENAVVNNMLISAISGNKLVEAKETFASPTNDTHSPFYNISGVILDGTQMDNIWDIFNLLTQKWSYIPNEKDISAIKFVLSKYYPVYCLEFFDEVLDYQKQKIEQYKQNNTINIKEVVTDAFYYKKICLLYWKYKILANFVFGRKRLRYKKKKSIYKQKIHIVKSILK